MKKVIILSLLAALVLSSADLAGQKSLSEDDSEALEQLQKSRFGRTVLKMLALKSQTQQVDFSRLFDAIDELSSSLNVTIQANLVI